MIRTVRIIGWLLMIAGVLITLSWFIEPMRQAWPHLYQSFRALPLAVQIGLVIAAVGFLILFSSLIAERLEDRKSEGNLLDDD